MSKKMDLLEAASKVVLKKGVASLTLDAVAEEAKVSKGGLLYHYATKEALIKAMNEHIITGYRDLIEQHATLGNSYHEAYLLATLDTLEEDSILRNLTTSLLAAISTNREILNLWREEYKYFQQRLAEEKYKPEYSVLVKSVCDGLWFSKLFQFEHISSEDEHLVIGYLLDVLAGEDL